MGKIPGSRTVPPELRPSLLTESREMGDVNLLSGTQQQILEIDETLQGTNGDPSALVAYPPEVALLAEYQAIRCSARLGS